MNEKVNLGEVTAAEYNLIMKQLGAGQLNECIDLFMKFREIAVALQQKAQQSQVQPVVNSLPPPKN